VSLLSSRRHITAPDPCVEVEQDKWQLASLTIIEIFSPQFVKSDNISRSLERQFLIPILTPVTISIITDGSKIDAKSLIQTEKNEIALRRI